MEPDDSAETASSQVSKQDETLGLSSAAGKHSSYSNVILSQITSSMERSVQLPVGSLESMDSELGRTRTDLKFIQQLPVLSPEPMDGGFQLWQEDSEIPKLLFEQGKGNSEFPEDCLDLHAKAYDPNATEYLTIRECLWHVPASKTGSPSLITSNADELISYLNGTSLIETLQWTSLVRRVSHEERAHEERKRIEAVLDAIGKCQSLRKLQIFGQQFKIEEVERLCQSLLRNQVEDLTLGCHDRLQLFYPGSRFEGTQTVCEMVAMNHNLKHFSFHARLVHPHYFGSMLATNSTLESLFLGEKLFPSFAVKVLLQPLTGDGENLPLNTTLKRLTITTPYATEAIVAMLATNNSLTHLTLHATPVQYPSSSDVCMIVQSLKTNKTFQKLTITKPILHDHNPWDSHDLETDDPWDIHDLETDNPWDIPDLETDDPWDSRQREMDYPWGPKGRDDVFAGIMDLLQVNPWLKDIDIWALDKAQREAIKAQLATNLEIVEKMDDFKTSQQIPIEGEVSRRMQEINLFTNPEASSVANLKVTMYKANPMSSFWNLGLHSYYVFLAVLQRIT